MTFKNLKPPVTMFNIYFGVQPEMFYRLFIKFVVIP